MEVDYSKTYWSNAGKHEDLNAKLTPLVPASGEVPNANLHPALETFRVASNCYYDLYNNGLCNRAQEFSKAFGFSASKMMARNRGLGWALTQEVIDRTETRMDEIILAAYAEQFPVLPIGLSSYPLPGSINNPHPVTFGNPEGPPVRCPFCGGVDITELDQLDSVSSEDAGNIAKLTEWQCVNVCGGRAFWV